MRPARPALLAALLGLWLGLAAAAEAASRVALVVGNGAYRHAVALRNPANDARAVSAALGRLGFEVITGLDLDRRGLEERVRELARRAQGAEAALFYYSGHGLEVAGRNYLVPVDARLEQPSDLPFETVAADTVLQAIEQAARVGLVFLDACRDNPLARSLARSMGASRSGSVGRGLAAMQAGTGVLLVFATDPGATAADGEGRNSPFTEALLAHLEKPGLEVRQVMTRVRQDVLARTGNRQRPWDSSSLTDDFYFKPAAPAPTPAAPAARDAEVVFWESIQNSRDPRAFEDYLRRFPNGLYAGLAALRRDELRASAAAPASEPRRQQPASPSPAAPVPAPVPAPAPPPAAPAAPRASPPAPPAVAALPPAGPRPAPPPAAEPLLARDPPLAFRLEFRDLGGRGAAGSGFTPTATFEGWRAAEGGPLPRLPWRSGAPAERWRLERPGVEAAAAGGTDGPEVKLVAWLRVREPDRVFGFVPAGGERIERAAIEEPIVWSYLKARGARSVRVGRHARLWRAFEFQYRLVQLGEAGEGRSCVSFAGVRGLEWLGGFWCAAPGATPTTAEIEAFLDGLGPPS
jgi:hypothetical protein